MELIVIGSSSKGNCYCLHNDSEALIIEAGLPYREVAKELGKEITKRVKMVIITHEHNDHAKYVKDWLDHGVSVYGTPGTVDALRKKHSRTRVWYMRPKAFSERNEANGAIRWNALHGPCGIHILPFATVHDADDPCGFILFEPSMGTVVFATDTAFMPSRISNLTNVLIECNYDEALLDQRTDIPETLKERIRNSHMSVTSCIEALKANDLANVQNIVLLHVSEGDGDTEAFRAKVEEQFGINTKVAEKGLKMAIRRAPF